MYACYLYSSFYSAQRSWWGSVHTASIFRTWTHTRTLYGSGEEAMHMVLVRRPQHDQEAR